MKKFVLVLLKILPHFCFALAFDIGALFTIDRFNRAMSFLDNNIAKWMIAVLCLLAIIESVVFAVMDLPRSEKRRAKARSPKKSEESDRNAEEYGTPILPKIILPFFVILLAVFMTVWFVYDRIDPTSGYMVTEYSKWPLAAFCILTVIQSVVCIVVVRIAIRCKDRAQAQNAPRKKKNAK